MIVPNSFIQYKLSNLGDMFNTASPEPNIQQLLTYHLSLLRSGPEQQELQEAIVAPIFTMPVVEYAEKRLSDGPEPRFPQYGLLAGLVESVGEKTSVDKTLRSYSQDPRIFHNTASPSSTFICGSQGSGKSHTLSCLLENCLFSSGASKLPHPLAGLVFHYDNFISDDGGSPCEAAFLSSNPKITVRILCSPANVRTIQASPSSPDRLRPTDIAQSEHTMI